MMHRTSNHARAGGRHGGFTLIELIVVITIIAVLVSLTAAVGVSVLRGSKERNTENLLNTLDRALEEYISEVGSIPGYEPILYEGQPNFQESGLVEYRGGMHPARPDAAVFLAQTRGTGVVGAIVESIPPRYLRPTPLPGGTFAADAVRFEEPSIVDSWAQDPGVWTLPYDITQEQVIYYVHPDNDLAQDLYGRCVNNRPYFLSAGADGLYGNLTDDELEESLFQALRGELQGEGVLNPPTGSRLGATEYADFRTIIEMQSDNLTSYPVEPINEAMFQRTSDAGVRGL
jgi:prepilin-type N-terminal cleavage/methylation domain-containing protein